MLASVLDPFGRMRSSKCWRGLFEAQLGSVPTLELISGKQGTYCNGNAGAFCIVSVT